VVDGWALVHPTERIDEFTPIAAFGKRGVRIQVF
jgi:hypothetical protein